MLEKLWSKIKYYAIAFGAGIVTVLLGLLVNRRGLSSSNDSFERVFGTVDDIKDGNTETTGIIGKLDSVNTGIKDTNGDAGSGIDAAIDGVDRAKGILSKAEHV